jgi:hypothetical protein
MNQEEYKNECYNCLMIEFKDQIKDQDRFNDSMMGNTGCIATCETCGKENAMIVYRYDIERAVRASQGQIINSAEWD